MKTVNKEPGKLRVKGRRKIFPNFTVVMITATLGLLFLIILCSGAGRYSVPLSDVVKVILSNIVDITETWEPQAYSVVMTLRLPRIITAVLVGGALALSGAAYQGVFKNPLVAPDMLGVSTGACVGASLGILCNAEGGIIQVMAFAGGLLAVTLAASIPRLIKNNSMMMLVLSGIIVTGLLDSVMGFLKYAADPDTELAEITHWQLGSLTKATWSDVVYIGPPVLIAAAVLFTIRWRINILSLGENEARSLGMNIGRLRGAVVICATVLTASAVCISGTIGWIGLVIPHLCRMICGPDNRKVIPFSIVMGAIFLLFIDTLARVLTSAELPLSILTGFVGAPFYFYLLLKQRMRLT